MAERLICGVDEAGRGPLAGPVCAAAVVFDAEAELPAGIADSKTVPEHKRDALAAAIRGAAIAWSLGWASVEEIDRLNILRATLLAMRRAVESLACVPQKVLVDGTQCPALALPARAIVGGDATVPAIAAASILAKTARDAEMRRLAALYPQYGLERHKGYPTPEHLAALARFGACEIHRKSFAPVARVLRSL